LVRRQYSVYLYPEIHVAFKLLCDQAGYKRLSEAVERIMPKCIEERPLGITPKGSREMELIRRVELLKKTLELRRRLGWKKSSGQC